MTPPATTHANRKPRFNKWDLSIFLGFPLVLLSGFLLFMHLKRNSADPNLRLVAQVTDDITVELVAVASQSRQKDGSIKWWKPNGLPAAGIKDNPKVAISGSSAPGFHFMYRFNDVRSGKDLIVGGLPSSGGGCSWSRNNDEKTILVTTTAKPDIWHTTQSIVRISTVGVQYIGELTPEHRKLSTSVGGRFATVAVLSGHELDNVTKYRPSPSVLRITEPLWESTNSNFRVEVFDEAGKKDPSVSMQIGRENDESLYFYYFKSASWSKIVIHRTVFDVIVTFDGIASQPDSITWPRVGNISRLNDK